MTDEEIDQLQPGSHLNYLIATEFFGGQKATPEQIEMIRVIACQFGHHGGEGDAWTDTVLIEPLLQRNRYTGAMFHFSQPRPYSTDIEYAWRIVERLYEMGLNLEIHQAVGRLAKYQIVIENRGITEHSGEVCLAICRAALKVKMKRKSDENTG